MRYRVSFSLMSDRRYFTEWFETLGEAKDFVHSAFGRGWPYIHDVEDENGNIV